MTTYLVLYSSPVSAAEQLASATPEQAEAGMAEWTAWAQRNGESIADLGQPLGEGRALEGGSSGPSSMQHTGYSLIKADSMDDAVTMLADHPHFHIPGASIDVFEVLPLM